MTFAQAKIAYLRDCLAQTGGNKRQAALIADVSRSHFYRLCERAGLHQRAIPKPKVKPSPFASWRLPAGVRT